MNRSPIEKNVIQTYASVFLLILTAGLLGYLFSGLIPLRKDFFNNLYAPVHLLSQGKSPYHTASLHPALPPLWFPMAIGIFSPLGWLSENAASQAWLLFNILETCLIIFICQGKKRTLVNTAAAIFICFFFPFIIKHFNLGQFSITAMLCLIASAHFAERDSNWLAACFLALGLTKPQLGFLAVAGFSVFHFQRSGVMGVIRFGLQTLLMSILMSLPLFIAYPGWIPDYIKSMQANSTWPHPSVFSLLRQSIGDWGILIWALLLVTSLVIIYKLWVTFPPHIAMLWSIGITTVISPYIWSWDFVLLLPIWIFTYANSDWKRKVFLLAAYAIGWSGMVYVQLQAASHEQHFWWAPLWFMGTVFLTANWGIKQKKGA